MSSNLTSLIVKAWAHEDPSALRQLDSLLTDLGASREDGAAPGLAALARLVLGMSDDARALVDVIRDAVAPSAPVWAAWSASLETTVPLLLLRAADDRSVSSYVERIAVAHEGSPFGAELRLGLIAREAVDCARRAESTRAAELVARARYLVDESGSAAPRLTEALVEASRVVGWYERFAVGKRAPGFRVELVASGESATLDRYAGRVLLIDFWATWCSPCLESLPKLAAVHRELEARGLAVLGVAVNDDPDAVRQFADEHHIPWDLACAASDDDIVSAYGVDSLPTMIVLDREGRVAIQSVWAEDPGALATALASVLGPRPDVLRTLP